MRLNWNDIEEMVENVCKQIIEKKYLVNHIITIGRGSMIPSRLISDRLNINEVSYIDVKLYKDVRLKNNKIQIKNFNDNIEKKNVLLVDDICDTSETIEETIKFLSDKKYNTLKTATLITREETNRKPTFFAKLVKKEWIIFPWEKREMKDCI